MANAHRVTEIVPVASLLGELAAEYRVAAGERVAHRLQGFLTTLSTLQERYAAARTALGELRERYEAALRERIESAKSAGVEAIEEQYEAALSGARKIQFRLATALADSWSLVRRFSTDKSANEPLHFGT